MTDRKPSWLDDQGEGQRWGPHGELVMWPCDKPGAAILDGSFTAKELREIADWIETLREECVP